MTVVEFEKWVKIYKNTSGINWERKFLKEWKAIPINTRLKILSIVNPDLYEFHKKRLNNDT